MGYEVQQIGDCTLYRGDCYELMPALQADALITDPPYGINYDCMKFRSHRWAQFKGHAAVPPSLWPQKIVGDTVPFDPRPWLHFAQIILWGGHLYTTYLPCSPSWLIWDKREGTTSDDYGDCELAWTNLSGVTRLHRQLWRGVIRRGEENAVYGKKLHPAQKPIALMRWCVQKTVGVVLDPFAGSFTTAHACVELGRPCIAIEIDPYYWELGCRRIEHAYAQPALFPVAAAASVQEVLL